MKAEELIQALSEVDDNYIEEAVRYKRSSSNMKIWRGIAIAACACLALSLAAVAVSLNSGSGGSRSASAPEALYYGAYEPETSASASGNRYYGVAGIETAEEEMYFEDAAEMMADEDLVPNAAINRIADNGTDILRGIAAEATEDALDADDAAAEPDPQAKIIYNVYMNLQTKEFENAVSGIESMIRANAGYTESQYISNYSGSYRSANYVIRVPAANLDALISQMGDLCTITYVNRSSEDVSESYYDVEPRLTTAKTKLARLQELLAQAEDMEDIITIESAISDTEWLIDNYSGTLRYYDSQVSYSTVTVNLEEVYEVVVEEAPVSFGDKVSQAFQQGLRGFGNFLKNFVIWLANSWIVLLIIAAVVVTACLIIRWIRRKKHSG